MSDRCGCCEPPAGLAPLPLENRPALDALAYRIGTYSSFRQTLLYGIAGKPALTSLSTRRSDDFAITLLELWAAVGDVLTFYQERYANEAFLRTARERESIVRLARLIDYRLSPGGAATARLVVTVEDPPGRVRIPVRLRVASVPAQDEEAQTFETLEELVADARLNELRVLPVPVAVNPLAPDTTQALLAPGSTLPGGGVELVEGDRLLVYDAGPGAEVEELAVAGVIAEEERLMLTWQTPIQRTGWTVETRVRQADRTFQLFGHDAEPAYLEPVVDASGRILGWKRVARPASDWALSPAELPLDAKYKIPLGTELLLEVIGSGVWPVVVTAVEDKVATLQPAAAKVTHVALRALGLALPAAIDRRRVRVHELVGPQVRFWGRAYPPTVDRGFLLVAGAAVDASTIEVGRTIAGDAFAAGFPVDVRAMERRRSVLAGDDVTPGALGRLASAEVVSGAIRFTESAADRTSAGELGLAGDASMAGFASAATSRTAPLFSGAEAVVTIGAVGPRRIPLGGLAAGAAAAADLEQRLRAADPADEFARARVVAAGDRLFVVPGTIGAQVAFAPTEADAATVDDLGLGESQLRAALLSAPPRQPTRGAVEVAAAIGVHGPVELALGAPTADPHALAATLRTALQSADLAPAFASSDVAVVGAQLLVLSGDPQERVQDYLRLEVRFNTPGVLDAASARLHGNVVLAGHGETVRDEIVGSGDASRAFQRFPLSNAPLTYIPSPRPEGAESTLELFVDGVRWREVPTLFDQPPTGQIFVPELGETGTTTLEIGDGRNGSRLPTGIDNVTATYRVGLGLAGRVRAGTLTGAVDRPPGLGDVVNPLPADGGADPEAASEARVNAPRTVRTFGRAVSFRDFEELVTASGEVAKAQATWVWDGFARALHLTVARAGGGAFATDGLRRLLEMLDAARDPNQPLLIGNARDVPIVLRAALCVRPEYVRADVLAAAHEDVVRSFSFDQLQLGEPVFLSDVFRLLQDVDGVLSVDVDELAFKQPAGMSSADFDAELTRRRVERSDGIPNPVQPRLRILRAGPDPERPGLVVSAELATIESPTHDVVLTGTGGIAE
jgi:hypothetical protein